MNPWQEYDQARQAAKHAYHAWLHSGESINSPKYLDYLYTLRACNEAWAKLETANFSQEAAP